MAGVTGVPIFRPKQVRATGAYYVSTGPAYVACILRVHDMVVYVTFN